MKQLLTAIAICCLALLAACGNDDTSNKDEKPATNDETALDEGADNTENTDGQTDDNQQVTDKQENADRDSSDNKESDDQKSADDSSSLSEYEEYPYLDKEIDNLDNYDPIVETDNPNKRVILYKADNNEKKYKSIFIKRQNRLKIIQLDDNGEIFNKIIK